VSASVMGLIYKITFGCMAAKAVAIKLGDNSNDDGENIFPAKATVAKRVECGKRTVDRYMDLWLVLGILRLDEMGGGRRSDETRRGKLRRRGRSSVYSFDMDLLRSLADREAAIEADLDAGLVKPSDVVWPLPALVQAAQSDGRVDDKGWALPWAVALAKGAIVASLQDAGNGSEPDTEQGAETVPPVHPIEEAKGCHPVTQRVPPSHVKGATVAPEPSLNHQRTINTPPQPPASGGRERGKSKRNEVDEIIADVRSQQADDVKWVFTIDALLAPVVRVRRLDAPSLRGSLQSLAAWLVLKALTPGEAETIVDKILKERLATVKPSDIERAVKVQIGLRPAAPVLRGDAGLMARWPDVIADLERNIGTAKTQAWFSTLVLEAIDGDRARVTTHLPHVAKEIESSYAAQLRASLSAVYGVTRVEIGSRRAAA
jgi:hypothetical protein